MKPPLSPARSNASLPPLHALQRRGANRLGNAAVDVVPDRLLDRRVRIVRVHALEAVARRPAHLRAAPGSAGVILERHAEEPDARILRARVKPGVGQLEKSQMLAQRERATVGHDRAHGAARAAGRRERQRDVDLGVVGKCLRVRPCRRSTDRAPTTYVPCCDRASVPTTSFQSRMTSSVASTSSWPFSSRQQRQRRDRARRERLGDRSRVVRIARASCGMPSSRGRRARDRRHGRTGRRVSRRLEPRSIPIGFEPRPVAWVIIRSARVESRGSSSRMRALPRVEIDWNEAVASLHSCRRAADRRRDWRRCCLRQVVRAVTAPARAVNDASACVDRRVCHVGSQPLREGSVRSGTIRIAALVVITAGMRGCVTSSRTLSAQYWRISLRRSRRRKGERVPQHLTRQVDQAGERRRVPRRAWARQRAALPGRFRSERLSLKPGRISVEHARDARMLSDTSHLVRACRAVGTPGGGGVISPAGRGSMQRDSLRRSGPRGHRVFARSTRRNSRCRTTILSTRVSGTLDSDRRRRRAQHGDEADSRAHPHDRRVVRVRDGISAVM